MNIIFAAGLVYLIYAIWIAYMILSVVTIVYIGRFNVHMLQQNGYKNNEQRTWLKKNWKKESVLCVWLVLSLLTTSGMWVGKALWILAAVAIVLMVPLTAFILYYYRFLKRYHTKKPLVFTARVKRMIFTDVVISGALFAFLVWAIRVAMADALIALAGVAVFQLVSFILSNIINHPVEKAISNYYTKDALKMLASQRERMTVIGITGSYGKTSMKYYLDELLSEKYDVLITPGNFNTPLGVVRTIREHMKSTNEIFLCEMGARYVGDIKELCDMVKPDMGVIASVGPQHLETFGGIENVISTKYELASAVTQKNGKLFLNGDNSYMIEESKKYPEAILYHSDPSANDGYRATNIRVTSHGTFFTAVTPDGESADFDTRLIGEHNVINVMGAIAVAHTLGIHLDRLVIPVRRLKPVAHRLEMKEQGDVTIIDDAYNSNPIGSKAAVETLKMMDGVRILVTPGMVELGEEEDRYNYEFGRNAAGCCDYVALVGRRRTEPIKQGLIDAGFEEKRVETFSRIEEALTYAYGIREHGHKVILLENDLPDNY